MTKSSFNIRTGQATAILTRTITPSTWVNEAFYQCPEGSCSASWVKVAVAPNKAKGDKAVCFWDFDLRPAAPLSPFEAKVRAYIDKELR